MIAPGERKSLCADFNAFFQKKKKKVAEHVTNPHRFAVNMSRTEA